MKKNQKNRDWEPWTESLIAFFAFLGLTVLTYYFYEKVVFEESVSTKGKVFQHLLQYLDVRFGKEYVYGVLILLTIWAGVSAYLGYSKQSKK